MEMQNFWSMLPPEVLLRLESESRTLEFKRGESVYQQGDEPRNIYFVEKGLVGLIITAAQSGKEHLIRFFKDGQFFGHRSLFAEEGYHGSTVALEKTVLKVVPKRVILDAIEQRPELLYNVVRVLSKELRRSELHQVMILENQIIARTAQALIFLKELYPEHNWTRQEIANFCASTVSTIIKTMGELENRGLIEQSGRTFKILDREGLIELQDQSMS